MPKQGSHIKSGYKIHWTEHALRELQNTILYLEKTWTERELQRFSSELEHTIELISKFPSIFPVSTKKKNVRKAVVAKYNNLYYRTLEDTIEILSLFSNRQNPNRKKVE